MPRYTFAIYGSFAVGILVLAILAITVWGQPDAKTPRTLDGANSSVNRSPATKVPVHWKLATIHVGRGGEGSVPLIQETQLSQRLQFLISALASNCGVSPEEAADISVQAQNLLMDNGVQYPLADLMAVILEVALQAQDYSCLEIATSAVTYFSVTGKP